MTNEHLSAGWIDDHMKDDVWKNLNAQPHAFTTGRPRPNPNAQFGSKKVPPRPKGSSQTLKQPGKLNLKSFAIVNEALARMNLGDNNNPVIDKKFSFHSGTKYAKSKSRNAHNAPLAAPEEDESNENVVGADDQEYEEAEYEQINDGFSEAVNNIASQLFTFSSQDPSARNRRHRREKEQQSEYYLCRLTIASCLPSLPLPSQGLSDSGSDSSSLERKRGVADAFNKNRKPQTHKKRQKKRVAIPVSTPKIPMGFEPNSGMGAAALMYQKLKNEINSTLEKGKTWNQMAELIKHFH